MGRTLAHRAHTRPLIGSVEWSPAPAEQRLDGGTIRPPNEACKVPPPDASVQHGCCAPIVAPPISALRVCESGFLAPHNKYVPVARRPSRSRSPNALAIRRCTLPTCGILRVHHLAPQAFPPRPS